MSDGRPDGQAPRYFGVYPAIVTDIVDPKSLGRVQVKLPFLGEDGGQDVRAWATLITPYADDQQGIEILPAVDTQVVVAFEAGGPMGPFGGGPGADASHALPGTPPAADNKRAWRVR